MNIAVLGSSGGSAFAAFHDILTDAFPGRYTFAAATDRACGLEHVCESRAIPLQRIDGVDNDSISRGAVQFLASVAEPDIILLYFLRLATPALYKRFPTFNIHPSLLPSFPGFRALEQTLDRGVRFFGATLHQVDGSVDAGPIVAQVVMPVSPGSTLEYLEKCSYLQKVYCALLLVDLIEQGALDLTDGVARLTGEHGSTDRSNPALRRGPLLERFLDLQVRERTQVIS